MVDANGDREPTNTSDQEPGQKPGDIVPLAGAQPAPQARKTECSASKNERNWIEIAGVTFIALGFLASAAAAGFSGWQAYLTNRSLDISNRAFISIIPHNTANSSPIFDLHGQLIDQTFAFHIENNGNTPAKGLTVSFICRPSDVYMSEPWPILVGAEQEKPARQLFVGAHSFQEVNCAADGADLALVDSGKKSFYILMRIVYFDKIEEKTVRTTQTRLEHLNFARG